MEEHYRKILKTESASFRAAAHPASAGSVAWACPSNIALIKYWGKRAVQLPMNPSISMTLKESLTRTHNHTCGGDKIEDQPQTQEHKNELCNSVLDLLGYNADAVSNECKMYKNSAVNNNLLHSKKFFNLFSY